jgi:phenylpropionate dioxygenase-like ring-hydroxylating dioxygenase large terminal subunit
MRDLPLPIEAVERTRRPLESATQLPGEAFTEDAVLAWELENLFRRHWVCAGHIDQLRETGQFLMVQLGSASVVLVADEDGLPRAFLNTCRHRGARLVDEPQGQLRRLRCPYHAWTYEWDGSLKIAPFTEGLEGFDRACYGLHQVRLAVVEGLVLVDLSGEADPPDAHVGALATHLAAYRTGELQRAGRIVYDVEANWKVVIENYSECLHCPGVHPELNRLSNYLTGDTYTGPGAWCGGSMTLAEDAETMGREGGGGHGRPSIAGVDERSVLYFALFPNALVSMHPDYVMLHTLWPREPGRTEIVCEWFFEPETAARADFDPSDAIEFWDQVNREDWHVCRLTQLGMSVPGFTPGRYTTQEGDVHDFDRMVADRYHDALAAAVTS